MTALPVAQARLTAEERDALFSGFLLDLRRLVSESLADREQLHGFDLRMQFALGAARLMKTGADLGKALERDEGPREPETSGAHP
jgi:hypothetical protein